MKKRRRRLRRHGIGPTRKHIGINTDIIGATDRGRMKMMEKDIDDAGVEHLPPNQHIARRTPSHDGLAKTEIQGGTKSVERIVAQGAIVTLGVVIDPETGTQNDTEIINKAASTITTDVEIATPSHNVRDDQEVGAARPEQKKGQPRARNEIE